jgi:hypothetical protein
LIKENLKTKCHGKEKSFEVLRALNVQKIPEIQIEYIKDFFIDEIVEDGKGKEIFPILCPHENENKFFINCIINTVGKNDYQITQLYIDDMIKSSGTIIWMNKILNNNNWLYKYCDNQSSKYVKSKGDPKTIKI